MKCSALQACVVRFRSAEHEPLELPSGSELARHLNALNSPVLFGCRTGICGTCLVRAEGPALPSPSRDEAEVLEILAPDDPRARLCCQLELTGDLELEVIE